MKRLLMIAYHFPPLRGSSGIQRTLRFAKHLPEHGWEPIVLTASASAYASTSDDQLADVPPGLVVRRAFALDSSRHLCILGRYPAALARPDRWKTWWLGAVPAGLALVRKLAPTVLWSTYPIATAHVIGGTLHRLTGLPWVADFRDPMAQDDYPPDAKTRQMLRAIDARVARDAARIVFTSPGARSAHAARHRELAPGRLAVIENGYDEDTFGAAPAPAPLNAGALTLLHSGIVYRDERDPRHLIEALRAMRQAGIAGPERLRVRFRASVNDDMIRELARSAGVLSMVEVLPPVDYRSALDEMQRADALLVMQAANCNAQIPAKLYEYFRAGRPIIALTDPAGDTAQVLRRSGCGAIAPLDDAPAIATLLSSFVSDPSLVRAASAGEAARHSRRARTAELAALLDSLVDEHPRRDVSRPASDGMARITRSGRV